MKIFSKKSVLLFSFIALGAYGIILACSDYYVEYDYDSSFTPEVYVDASYSPLFFSSQDVFYKIGYEQEYVSRHNDAIKSDWSGYLKGSLTENEVAYFLLNDSATSIINSVYGSFQKKQKPTVSLAEYSKINYSDAKVKSFIEFMHYAKIIEASSVRSFNSWDYDESKELPKVDAQFIVQVEKLYSESKDPFLKNRYWFQAMKANFYGGGDGVINFFEKTKASVPQNTLYYRGVAYVAGVHYRNKNYATSNYLYSLVFDKEPELRSIMIYNFHVDEAGLQSSLAITKTTTEKEALWAMVGYYTDEKDAIHEIYKLNPSSKHLDYLLTRLVNKEEVKLNNQNFTSADADRKTTKDQTDKDGLQLVTSIAKEEKTATPYLWNIAAGYLNTLSGNTLLASQYFDKVEKQGPKSELAGNQLQLLRFINTLYGTAKMDDKTEHKLIAELKWLYHDIKSDDVFRYHHALSWSKKYISSLYKSQQNLVLAELFNRDYKFYRIDANLEAMKSFLQKPSKTEWENLALSIYDVSISDIFEYQAEMSAYGGNLDEAITFLERSNNKNVPLLGNPFNGKIKDCHDCDHAAVQKVTYTKMSLLVKMKEMLGHIQTGEDVYNNSLLLANAYYNMSYFGNARVFYSGNIMNQNESNDIDTYYQPQLLNCSVANQYYQKAFDNAANDEQKVKCVYMMAKCVRNKFYTDRYFSKGTFYGDSDVHFLAWDGFKKLKANYSMTKYYKDVLAECGYFESYVKK